MSKLISRLLWFRFTVAALCDWLAKFAPLSQPTGSQSQTKTNRDLFARVFSALDAGSHVFESNSGWFTALVKSVVIGQPAIALVLVFRRSKSPHLKYVLQNHNPVENSMH